MSFGKTKYLWEIIIDSYERKVDDGKLKMEIEGRGLKGDAQSSFVPLRRDYGRVRWVTFLRNHDALSLRFLHSHLRKEMIEKLKSDQFVTITD